MPKSAMSSLSSSLSSSSAQSSMSHLPINHSARASQSDVAASRQTAESSHVAVSTTIMASQGQSQPSAEMIGAAQMLVELSQQPPPAEMSSSVPIFSSPLHSVTTPHAHTGASYATSFAVYLQMALSQYSPTLFAERAKAFPIAQLVQHLYELNALNQQYCDLAFKLLDAHIPQASIGNVYFVYQLKSLKSIFLQQMHVLKMSMQQGFNSVIDSQKYGSFSSVNRDSLSVLLDHLIDTETKNLYRLQHSLSSRTFAPVASSLDDLARFC